MEHDLVDFLSRECEKDRMPQMRWAYQIFGNSYNPHDPKLEHDFYHILKRAYMHEKCDPQTVQLYFREQLDTLWWGQHHFPESCGITDRIAEGNTRTLYEAMDGQAVGLYDSEECTFWFVTRDEAAQEGLEALFDIESEIDYKNRD